MVRSQQYLEVMHTSPPNDTKVIFARVDQILAGAKHRKTDPSMQTPEVAEVFQVLLDRIDFDRNTRLPGFELFKRQLATVSRDRKRKTRQEIGDAVVVFCDINDFGKINKKLGHDVGDDIIRAVSQIIREEVNEGRPWQPIDFIARSYRGGDEFLVLINADKKYAKEIMEEINEKLKATKFVTSGRKPKVIENLSLAYGIYQLDSKDPKEALKGSPPRGLTSDMQSNDKHARHAKFAVDEADRKMCKMKKEMKKGRDYQTFNIRKATHAEIRSPEEAEDIIHLADGQITLGM